MCFDEQCIYFMTYFPIICLYISTYFKYTEEI